MTTLRGYSEFRLLVIWSLGGCRCLQVELDRSYGDSALISRSTDVMGDSIPVMSIECTVIGRVAVRELAAAPPLERFRAKACPGLDPGRIPVRVKKTRQNKNREPRSDSIGTEKALVTIFLRLRPTLWFGLRVADGLGQHLAQLGLRLRRLARCSLPLGHADYVGMRPGGFNRWMMSFAPLSSTGKVISAGCGSMILIGAKLGELLVFPMPSIMTAPDLSIDESACDGSTRNEDSPQVPCLTPGWLRPQVHYHSVIVAVSNHERLSKNKDAERSIIARRLCHCLVRMGAISGAGHASTFAFRRNESRPLS